MRVEITGQINKPFQLPASEYLQSTKDKVSDFPSENYRHPLAIYNISVTTAIDSALNLINHLENIMPFCGSETAEKLMSNKEISLATKGFLLSVGEHIDACEKVILCYFQSKDKKTIKNSKENLRKNLEWYEKHIMTQANHIKHKHSQIRNICLYTTSLAVPGYFIESAIDSQCVGPDPDIHHENTAFSYMRELRVFVCGLIYISKSLSSVLRKNSENFVAIEDPSDNTKFKELIKRVSFIPEIMLPDEYNKKYPSVYCNDKIFKISFGKLNPPRVPYNGYSFKTATTADGVTRGYQMPYMQNEVG
jgi:hypothetical protein